MLQTLNGSRCGVGARYVPAGVYMVNTTLIIRKPSENTSVAKPQPYVTTGLRMVGEGT